MTKFQEKNPSNARILIDHKKKSVKFEYPNKHHHFTIIFATSTMIWILINFVLTFIVILSYVVFFMINSFFHPACTNTITTYTSTKCGIISFDFSSLKYLYIMLVYSFLPPLMFTLLFMDNERLVKNMPKLNMAISLFPFGRYYIKEITSLNSKVFEIPIFDNTFLDYEAEGEFSSYLEKVQILEHDLDFCRASIFSNKVKKTRNEHSWKARFIFSDIPKTGWLKVKFK